MTDWKIFRSSSVSARSGLALGRLDRRGREPELLQEPLGAQRDHEDADRAGHRRGMGDDRVGGERHVVAAGRGDVQHDRDDGPAGLALEQDELSVDDVGGRHGPAGAVDAYHERAHLRVGRGFRELLADAHEQGHPRRGRAADDEARRATLVGEKSRDIQQEDLGAAMPFDRLLAERLDPRREVERDERAGGEERDQRERGQSSHGMSI